MRLTKRQLRRIIKESKGWFLLGLDGTLAKSQKTRTPIWWSNEAGAQQAYDSGYGGEGAVPVEVLLAPDPYAYNGSDADPADLESVRQHWVPGTLNKVPSELGESKIKITKRQLRKIIREEKQRIQEQGDPNYPAEPWDSPVGDSVRRAVVKLLDADREEIFPKGDPDMVAFLMRLADDLKGGTV